METTNNDEGEKIKLFDLCFLWGWGVGGKDISRIILKQFVIHMKTVKFTEFSYPVGFY